MEQRVLLTLLFSILSVLGIVSISENAFAITAEEFVVTGGTGSDGCNNIAISGFESLGNEVVWLGCDDGAATDDLWAIDADTGVPLASNLALGASVYDTRARMFNCGDDCVILMNAGDNSIERYELNSTRTGIEKTGDTALTCSATNISMDASGYIWIACGTTDVVIMFNPVSMGVMFTTANLDDGGALDCGNIRDAGADAFALVGFAVCGDEDRILSFTYTHTAAGWAYGAKVARTAAVITDASPTMYVDGFRNRILSVGSTGGSLDVYEFSNDGTGLTEVQSNLGATTHTAPTCEPYVSGLIICAAKGSTATMEFYAMNGTEATVTNVVNVLCTVCGTTATAGQVGTNFVDAWAMGSANGADAKYLIVHDVADDYPYTPLTPEEFDETCESGSDVDCDFIEDTVDNCPDDANFNQTDTDGDGWGDACDLTPGGSGSDVGTGNYNPGTLPGAIIDYATLNGALSAEAAGLILAALVHGGMLFIPALIALKTGQIAPGFVWMFFFILGSGLSLAFGFMPILYFGIEMAVVGISLALVMTGAIGGRGGGV